MPIWELFSVFGITITGQLAWPVISLMLICSFTDRYKELFRVDRTRVAISLLIFTVIFTSFLRNGIGFNNLDYKSFIMYCLMYLIWFCILNMFWRDHGVKLGTNLIGSIIGIFLLINSILSIGSYVGFPPVLWICDNMYSSFNVIDGVIQSSTMGDGTTLRRTTGMFSSSTQLGSFGILALLILFGFKEKVVMSYHVLFSLAIVVSSESRTALGVFFVVLLYIYFNRSPMHLIVLIVLLMVLIACRDIILSDRVLDAMNSVENFSKTGEKQRLFYWLLFFDRVAHDPYILVYGLDEISTSVPNRRNFFENEYFNMVSRGGLLALVAFLSIYPLHLVKRSTLNVTRIGYLRIYMFTIIVLGMVQGLFFSPRFILINAIVFSFLAANHPDNELRDNSNHSITHEPGPGQVCL